MRRPCRWLLLVTLAPGGTGCRPADNPAGLRPEWELKPPAPDAVPVAAEEKMPGVYPVGTGIKDAASPGGFGPCDNYPKSLGAKDWGTRGHSHSSPSRVSPSLISSTAVSPSE